MVESHGNTLLIPVKDVWKEKGKVHLTVKVRIVTQKLT